MFGFLIRNSLLSQPAGSGGRSRTDAVGADSMCLEEQGAVTEIGVNHVCDSFPIGLVDGIEVGLDRDEQCRWRVRMLAQNGLAANDDELVPVCQVGRGTDDVLELVTPHGWCCADAP